MSRKEVCPQKENQNLKDIPVFLLALLSMDFTWRREAARHGLVVRALVGLAHRDGQDADG